MARVYADDLQRSIEELIRDRFDVGDIVSVEVDGYRVCDEDAGVDIIVTYRGTASEFARKEPLGFLSQLREFVKREYDAFPAVRFRPASV